MPILVRRSNLVVPITNPRFVADCWRWGADAVTLDLEDGVLPSRKVEARGLVRDAVGVAGRGGAEVWVRVNRRLQHADIPASVWPGVSGIVLPRVDSAGQVKEAAALLTAAERAQGLEEGSLQMIPLLECAKGVWNVREIISASPRVTQVGLDESDLAAELGISPQPEYDPFVYARGRVAIEATAAGVQPIGSAYPLGTAPRDAAGDEAQMLKQATNSRNLGFKGMLCPHPSWVGPVNTAFTPTASQVEFYTQVRQVFAQAVAAGTAAAPFAGRMIDVPVDEWAKVVLALADACAQREAQKQAALARAGAQ